MAFGQPDRKRAPRVRDYAVVIELVVTLEHLATPGAFCDFAPAVSAIPAIPAIHNGDSH